MKAVIIITFSLLSLFASGQKQITITQSFQTVPKGKIWRLEMNLLPKSTLVELNIKQSAFFQEFYFLNHTFHFIGNVVNIDPGEINRKNHLIVCDSLLKVPYANAQTYSINLTGAINPRLMGLFTESITDSKNRNWMDCMMSLEFKEGTQVAVSDCLKSIQLIEYSAN